MISMKGDLLDENGNALEEELELWMRDPVEVVKELLGNPAFRDHMHFTPERHYSDPEQQSRKISEMWTGDWWWTIQVSLLGNEKDPKLTC
jgi:hypothetical protein